MCKQAEKALGTALTFRQLAATQLPGSKLDFALQILLSVIKSKKKEKKKKEIDRLRQLQLSSLSLVKEKPITFSGQDGQVVSRLAKERLNVFILLCSFQLRMQLTTMQ